jgi:uncharacterized membrane protein
MEDTTHVAVLRTQNKEKRLRNSTKRLKTLVMTVTVVAAFAAIIASSASAAVVSAKFSNETIKLTTTGVTIKKGGLDARTCTIQGGSASGITNWFGGYTMVNENGEIWFNCSGSTVLQLRVLALPKYDNVALRYFLQMNDAFSTDQASPYGRWWQDSPSLPDPTYINGSGATKSQLKFVNEPIGYVAATGAAITLDGTFTATTTSNTLLTLSH